MPDKQLFLSVLFHPGLSDQHLSQHGPSDPGPSNPYLSTFNACFFTFSEFTNDGCCDIFKLHAPSARGENACDGANQTTVDIIVRKP